MPGRNVHLTLEKSRNLYLLEIVAVPKDTSEVPLSRHELRIEIKSQRTESKPCCERRFFHREKGKTVA